MYGADSGRFRQQPRSARGAKRILHRSQVPAHANFEYILFPSNSLAGHVGGLNDHARAPAKLRRQFLYPERLQDNQPRSKLNASPGRLIPLDITV
jgi:hypothetical protein